MMTDTPTPKPETPTPHLILASQSPRRAQLLRDAGIVFTQQPPPFADPDQPPEAPPPPKVDPDVAPASVPEDASHTAENETRSAMSPAERFAADLAAQKAVSMVQQVPAGFGGCRGFRGLILAADTICVSMSPGHEGKLIGKPRDRVDAEAMLRGFMNGAHAVVSGVALLEVGSPSAIAASRRDAGRAASTLEPILLADTAIVTFGQVSGDDLNRYLASGDWLGKAGGYNLFDRQVAGWPITVEGDPTTVVGLPMGKLGAALAGFGITTPR